MTTGHGSSSRIWLQAAIAVLGVFAAVGVGVLVFGLKSSDDRVAASVVVQVTSTPIPETPTTVPTAAPTPVPTAAPTPTAPPTTVPPVPTAAPTPQATVLPAPTETASDLVDPTIGRVTTLDKPNPALDPPQFQAVGINQVGFGLPIEEAISEVSRYFGEPSFTSADGTLTSWGGTGGIYAVRIASDDGGRFDGYQVNFAALADQNWGRIRIGETHSGSVPFWLDADDTDQRLIFVDEIDGLGVRCSVRGPCLHQEILRSEDGAVDEFRRIVLFAADARTTSEFAFGDALTSDEVAVLQIASEPTVDGRLLEEVDLSAGATVASIGPPVTGADGRQWIRVLSSRNPHRRAGWVPFDGLRPGEPNDGSGPLPRVDIARPAIQALVGQIHGDPTSDFDMFRLFGVSEAAEYMGSGIVACCVPELLVETAAMNPSDTAVDILLSAGDDATDRFVGVQAWSLVLGPDQLVWNNYHDDFFNRRDVRCGLFLEQEAFVVYDTSFTAIAAWTLTEAGLIEVPDVSDIYCGPGD